MLHAALDFLAHCSEAGLYYHWKVSNIKEEFVLNDLIYTQEPLVESPRTIEADPDWDEEASLERSKKRWEKFEQMEREFEERTKDLVVS